jgi:phosphoglycerol transferase MdoB-like AlkP superfamily enzyme
MTYRFDYELGKFIHFLKEQGLYDNSVIVIVSDHAPHSYADQPTFSKAIPFIVLNSGIHYESNVLAGQIDVYPTILDIMGKLDDSPWPGFGHSLFRKQTGVVGYTRSDGELFSEKTPIDITEQKRIKLGRELSEKILLCGHPSFIIH